MAQPAQLMPAFDPFIGPSTSALVDSPSSPLSHPPHPPPKDATPFATPIKSVSVPHHSKSSSGKWIYACRVVPEANHSAPQGANGLGKMTMAGLNEPHTVWRSWSEFLGFSTRLSDAFPTSNPSSPAYSPTGSPSPITPPRLKSKFALRVTKNVVAQRQEELDDFVRRLFQMPDHIKNCDIVRDFFKMRGSQESPNWSPSSVLSSEAFQGPESFSQFLSNVRARENPSSTVRVQSTVSRPALGMKSSTPDLRKLLVSDETPGRPELNPRSMSSMSHRPLEQRASNYSTISGSSASSSATITPTTVPPSSLKNMSSRLPSPLSQQEEAEKADLAEPTTPASVPLRNYQSMQNLRTDQLDLASESPDELGHSSSSAEAPSMQRALTSPARPQLASIQTDVQDAIFGHTTRPQNRRTSSKSSISSFEDAGSPSSAVSNPFAAFHIAPSGRIDRGPDPRTRRPSIPARKTSFGKHSHSASSSSIDSTRSSFEMGRTQSHISRMSRGSSTDYSEGFPVTPPTPHMARMVSEGLKYSWQSNNLPPAPFFPLPPTSMPMQAAYSYDGMSHSLVGGHRRKSSNDSRSSRSRSGSIYSQRALLDPITGSPDLSSCATFEPSPLIHASSATSPPTPSDKLIIKVLHPASNVLIRVDRAAQFDRIKEQIEAKFRACGISLAAGDERDGSITNASVDAKWKLVYVPTKKAIEQFGASTYVLETAVEYQHCIAASNADKITVRVAA